MAMHKLRVTQVSRVEREIVIEVEANDIDAAVELQQESEAPSINDPRWTTVRADLMNEDVEPA